MKKLFLIILLCSAALAAPIINSYRFASAAGGPDVWYSVEAATNDASGLATSAYLFNTVTVGVAGTATKLRAYIDYSGDGEVKLALYNGTTLMSSGTATATASGYVEVTLAVPQAVSAANYVIAIQTDSGGVPIRYASAGGFGKYEIASYAAFPPATLAAGTDIGRKYWMGVYVD